MQCGKKSSGTAHPPCGTVSFTPTDSVVTRCSARTHSVGAILLTRCWRTRIPATHAAISGRDLADRRCRRSTGRRTIGIRGPRHDRRRSAGLTTPTTNETASAQSASIRAATKLAVHRPKAIGLNHRASKTHLRSAARLAAFGSTNQLHRLSVNRRSESCRLRGTS